jgi:SAM-dependent methyltransferase
MKSLELESDYLCPICSTELKKEGNQYSINDLFSLLEPVQFSKETINEHRNQSSYTQMYFCPECGLGIFLPQIIGTPNFYIELQKDISNSYYATNKWEFEEALKDLTKSDSIIEIGCGPANFLEKAFLYVKRVYGVEYNELALEIARNKGIEVFGNNDEKLNKVKGQLDAVFSFHVLEHVADPVRFVEDLNSYIKPGGKIGISVPNMDGPIKYINPCIMNMPPHHATRWKLSAFKKLATNLGFKIERVAYEPIDINNYYYYSYYWVNHILPPNFLFTRSLQLMASIFFVSLFKILAIFDKTTINRIRGQSIYIVMSKPLEV